MSVHFLSDSISKINLKHFYDQYNVNGMMAIEDISKNVTFLFNPQLFQQPVSPASTFNILLTLIGIDEKHLMGTGSVLTRGGIKYTSSFPGDKMTLEEGFKNNRDWFFIRLSRLIGYKRMKFWLDKINYGNRTLQGEQDRFWINGDLKISPEQQLAFIKDFYYEKLPFSKKAYAVVKGLLFQKQSGTLKIFGKRGSNKIESDQRFTGWFVGYIEAPKTTYFFANFIESKNMNHPTLIEAQKEIAFNIFTHLHLK